MSQQQNIPDPELFTKEIEDTIDSLFTPTREIEIDPVTNEVREVKRDAPVEDEGKKEPGLEAHQEEELTLVLEEDEGKEELTIELEDVDVSEEPSAHTGEEPSIVLHEAPTDETIEKIEHQLNQLYQMLLTLEWEITKEDLTSAYEILKNVADKVKEAVESRDANLIIDTMLRIMKVLKEEPEAVSPNAPKALEMGLEALIAIVQEKDGLMPETKERIKKAKEFMALVRFGEEAKREREGGGRKAPKPQEATLSQHTPTMDNDITLAEDLGRAASKEINRERLQAVLEDLTNCVERIIPVQGLLARHKKSQKLFKFLDGIKGQIETSIQVLSEELELEAPEIKVEKILPKDIVAGVTGETTAGSRKELPPFKEVCSTRIADVKVAFLPNEIAYIGPTLGFGNKVSVTDGVFPLKALKKWPWSKISGILRGELAHVEEKKLRTLTLPILSDLDGIDVSKLGTPRQWVLLFKDEKGAAIPVNDAVINLALDDSWHWVPEDNEQSKWLGSLTSRDEILKVVSIERVFNSL